MSALDLAAEQREPVEHFDQLALLERGALGAHADEVVALCEAAHERSQALIASEPEAETLTGLAGLLRGKAAAREHEARVDAWHEELDELEAATTAALERWRSGCDPAFVAAATADRDAAMRSLVERGLMDAATGEAMCAEPIGMMFVHSALAHD